MRLLWINLFIKRTLTLSLQRLGSSQKITLVLNYIVLLQTSLASLSFSCE